MFCNFIHNYVKGLNYDNFIRSSIVHQQSSRNHDYITKPLNIQIRLNDPSYIIYSLNKSSLHELRMLHGNYS